MKGSYNRSENRLLGNGEIVEGYTVLRCRQRKIIDSTFKPALNFNLDIVIKPWD